MQNISIHALREEGDGGDGLRLRHLWNFYPRPPRGGRPVFSVAAKSQQHFYPRPPRGGRRGTFVRCLNDCIISIHALREEGDEPDTAKAGCMEIFLSTPSARRATINIWKDTSERPNFYPRPPRGGRPISKVWYNPIKDFYPRPPRGGRPGRPPRPSAG